MAIRPEITGGKVSDLVKAQEDVVDWSHLRDDLEKLEPGETLSVKCPDGMRVSRLRSTILTYGKRIFEGKDWTVSTRTIGGRVHCFLVKVDIDPKNR